MANQRMVIARHLWRKVSPSSGTGIIRARRWESEAPADLRPCESRQQPRRLDLVFTHWIRMSSMFTLATILSACLAAALPSRDEVRSPSPFAERGYYITFMRMPCYDLADWKRIVDGIHD